MEHYEHESERRGLPLQRVLGDDADRRAALVAIVATSIVVSVLVVLAVVVGSKAGWWFFGVLAAIGIATLVLAVRNVRVWVAWGNPQLFLPSSDELHLGDQVIGRFRRRARAGVDPSRVELTAALVCEERVHQVDGSVRRVRVFDQPVEVTIRDLDDASVEADLALVIPLFDASPTIDLLHTFEVAWFLEVHLVAAGAPDDDSTFALMISPAVSPRLVIGGAR